MCFLFSENARMINLFVLDLQNNRYMISDSATKIFPFEASEMFECV